MLERLASVSGIPIGDLRYKMIGRGVARMTPALPGKQQEALAGEMNAMGIPAAVVAEERLRRHLFLPLARRVEITDTETVFFDRDDKAVFTVDKTIDLLVIIGDLSGRAVEKPFAGLEMEQPAPSWPFDMALKKVSMNKPVAVFSAIGTDPPAGVLVDHALFAYPSLEDLMEISAGVNFRVLINETIKRAKSSVTDHKFGAEPLAGVIPEWDGGKREILAALGRYTLYILAAVESGIIRPGGITCADDSYSIKDEDDEESGAAPGEDPFDLETPPEASTLPEPPEAADRSGILAILHSAPQELVFSFVFGIAFFHSIFLPHWNFTNPFFWQTVSGLVLITAGVVFFPYALVLLHYKRMVENTPTSRVRSLAMGMVELEGRTRQYYNLKTTHSRTRCIYYRCRYYRLHRTSDGMQRRKLMRETDSGRLPFYLEDDTGHILVRPEGALLLISKYRQEFYGAESMWLPAELQSTMTRIYEDLIAEGANVYILGHARPERVGPAITDRIVDRLRLLKRDRERLMEYDTNGDGQIDGPEWDAARADAERQAYTESLMDQTPAEHAVIRKPRYGFLPFIISDTEKGITRRLAVRFWIFMIGGLGIMGLGVKILVHAWGM